MADLCRCYTQMWHSSSLILDSVEQIVMRHQVILYRLKESRKFHLWWTRNLMLCLDNFLLTEDDSTLLLSVAGDIRHLECDAVKNGPVLGKHLSSSAWKCLSSLQSRLKLVLQ